MLQRYLFYYSFNPWTNRRQWSLQMKVIIFLILNHFCNRRYEQTILHVCHNMRNFQILLKKTVVPLDIVSIKWKSYVSLHCLVKNCYVKTVRGTATWNHFFCNELNKSQTVSNPFECKLTIGKKENYSHFLSNLTVNQLSLRSSLIIIRNQLWIICFWLILASACAETKMCLQKMNYFIDL